MIELGFSIFAWIVIVGVLVVLPLGIIVLRWLDVNSDISICRDRINDLYRRIDKLENKKSEPEQTKGGKSCPPE